MAKKPTYEELQAKIDFYEYSVDENRKIVRKALREHKIWKPEFHENEVAAITAIFLATKELLDQSQAELSVLKKTGEIMKGKLHIGTKLILALAMTRLEYNKYLGWELPEDEKHLANEEGRLVEYVDGGKPNHPDHEGYISWYPLDVFNNSYKTSGEMSFGMAIEAAKRGYKVARKGWNGNALPPQVKPFPVHMPVERLEVKGDYCYLLSSKGSVAVFDACLIDRLQGKAKFTEGSGGYFCVSLYEGEKQRNVKLHTLLFDCPEGLLVDHINGNVLDNRQENIRFLTKQQNSVNTKPRKGNFKGVSFDNSRNLFISSIQKFGKTKHVGRFECEIEAAKAYDKEAYKLHGQYARLNFPDEQFTPRMFAYIVPKNKYPVTSPGSPIKGMYENDMVPYREYWALKTAQDDIATWSPSGSDSLADDWVIVE